jgi:hypothetical protein
VVESAGRVALLESDTLYLGRPAALAVDSSDGSLYVTDGFWGRVLRFSPSGELLRAYGTRGEGPGELKGPSALALAGGELLVSDVGKRELSRFDLATGRFVGSTRYSGIARSLEPAGGGLWLGLMNVEGKTSLGRWTASNGRVTNLGAVPAEFTQSPPLAGIYTGVQVVAWGDTVLAGFMGLNRLVLFRADGSVIRNVRVPVRERRGEVTDVVGTLAKLEFPEQFGANSSLFRMHRLPSGNFALVHYDQVIDGNLITAKVYLTLLSRDFARSCADRRIAVSEDAQPYTAFRGDTLYVVQQRVAEERAASFVDRYRIREDRCFA